MPRINNDHQSYVILDERGGVIDTVDTVQAADQMAISCARDRPGKNYYVAMVVARFGLPNVAPTKVELLANDMAAVPDAPRGFQIEPIEFDPAPEVEWEADDPEPRI